jgi:alpha-L-fucosidase 2
VRDIWIPASFWALGAAWLSIHIWEHYEYTLDKKFLEKYFYLLKEACVFFIDFLVPAKTTNEAGRRHLIVSPSSSPENSFMLNGEPVCLCAGCEMDNQILRKLFRSTIKSAEILDIKNFDAEQFHSVLERIPDTAIHSNGTIREWNKEYEEAETGHRHFSHLWALWPGDSITQDETPCLAQAARKSIKRRLSANGGHTGWSRSWLINFFARLNDGKAAFYHLNAIYNDFTLPNLFNSHPPFQIDGNFGSLSGITQMLVKSRIRFNERKFTVILDILPALPKKWANGGIKGVCAKGNLELDFSWKKGRLISFSMKNKGYEEARTVIRWEGKKRECIIQSGQIFNL